MDNNLFLLYNLKYFYIASLGKRAPGWRRTECIVTGSLRQCHRHENMWVHSLTCINYKLLTQWAFLQHCSAEDRLIMKLTCLCSPIPKAKGMQLCPYFSFLFWPEKPPWLEKPLTKDLTRLTFPRINTSVKYSWPPRLSISDTIPGTPSSSHLC